MNKLIAELQRLYFPPNQQWPSGEPGDGSAASSPVAFDPVCPEGRARAMAIRFEKAADWEWVAKLCQGVQEDLELPAPALSVSGKDGYQLWFSLAEAVPVEEARAFLNALRLNYLADIPGTDVQFHPDFLGTDSTERPLLESPPALHKDTGRWSAFIDPALGSMFVHGAGLEMAPNPDKQADLLAGLESIGVADFQRVLATLKPGAEPADELSERSQGDPAARRSRSRLGVGSNFSDPRSFLLAVMNDPSASARQRIRAAKTLLPYFEKASV